MTALEICNSLSRYYCGEYSIVMNGSPSGFVFLKRWTEYHGSGDTSFHVFNANGKTYDDFVRFVAKNNLENYLVCSLRHLSRPISPFDITIDNSGKVVIFE